MCVAVLLYFIKQMCYNFFVHFIAGYFLGLFLVWGYMSNAVMNITVPVNTWACIFYRLYTGKKFLGHGYIYFQLCKRVVNYFPKGCITLHFHQLYEFLLLFLSTKRQILGANSASELSDPCPGEHLSELKLATTTAVREHF